VSGGGTCPTIPGSILYTYVTVTAGARYVPLARHFNYRTDKHIPPSHQHTNITQLKLLWINYYVHGWRFCSIRNSVWHFVWLTAITSLLNPRFVYSCTYVSVFAAFIPPATNTDNMMNEVTR